MYAIALRTSASLEEFEPIYMYYWKAQEAYYTCCSLQVWGSKLLGKTFEHVWLRQLLVTLLFPLVLTTCSRLKKTTTLATSEHIWGLCSPLRSFGSFRTSAAIFWIFAPLSRCSGFFSWTITENMRLICYNAKIVHNNSSKDKIDCRDIFYT